MTFTDKQMFDAIEANSDVKECFEKISQACKQLKINTGCPDDDVDRFLEFSIGKWDNLYWLVDWLFFAITDFIFGSIYIL